jgi:hypothetical protein
VWTWLTLGFSKRQWDHYLFRVNASNFEYGVYIYLGKYASIFCTIEWMISLYGRLKWNYLPYHMLAWGSDSGNLDFWLRIKCGHGGTGHVYRSDALSEATTPSVLSFLQINIDLRILDLARDNSVNRWIVTGLSWWGRSRGSKSKMRRSMLIWSEPQASIWYGR